MGDTPDDIRAAVTAGGNAIGVLTPHEQAKVKSTTNKYHLLTTFKCLRLLVLIWNVALLPCSTVSDYYLFQWNYLRIVGLASWY